MDDEIEQECLRVMRECEEQARSWGLSVCVRTFAELEVPGDRGAVGFFIESPLPGWGLNRAVVAVDVQASLQLSDPAGRLSSWISHELAHAAVSALEHCTIPCEPHEASVVAAGIASPVGPAELLKTGLPVWTGHCRNFIRGLCHAQWRLRAACNHVSDVWSFPAGDYKLSPLSWYASELRVECERLADLPIVQALQARAPAGFLELWRADIARAAQKTQGPPGSPSALPTPPKSPPLHKRNLVIPEFCFVFLGAPKNENDRSR